MTADKVNPTHRTTTPRSKAAFTKLASDQQIEHAMKALQANGIQVLIAKDGAEAKRLFFELVPAGSEVFLGASVTLEKLGIQPEIDKSGRFDALRPKLFAMDRNTQAREIRKLGASPEIAAGSVHAVTEDGKVLIASMTGSQLGPYASGAGKVIWVVGTQKIVKDFNAGLRRIEEYCVPLEEAHMQELYHRGTSLNKVLMIHREIRPGRISLIFVKEVIGF
jgi:hypothetical protein